jgi:hypothetical protein
MKMCKDCYYRKQIHFETKLLHLLDWYCNNPDSVFYRYYVSPKHGCNDVLHHRENVKKFWLLCEVVDDEGGDAE